MTQAAPPETPAENFQIQELREQLAHAQKMASVGVLASGVVHDFNNILTTIMNYASFSVKRQDPDYMLKAMGKIHAATVRAADIADNVLGFVRKRTDSITEADLVELVDETLALVERDLTKHGIKLVKNYEAQPQVRVRPSQIQQVVLNLILNAIHAMEKDGGTLTVDIGESPCLTGIQIVVGDTGCGIPLENHDSIFEPFFSTKQNTSHRGTGLGLSVSRDIIESHGGRIHLESYPGAGATFTVHLPKPAHITRRAS